MRVLIMAAGNAARCFEFPKQLLMLPNGETILDRQLRQITERGHVPTVVTHRKEIADHWHSCYEPEDRTTLCNSILGTTSLWADKTVIVLGDVVFTDKGMDMLLGSYKPCSVVGNEAEIYGASFLEIEYGQVTSCLIKGARHVHKNSVGKMRYFYKAYVGLPLTGSAFETTTLQWLRDETNDIDDMGAYENMIARWNSADNQPGW